MTPYDLQVNQRIENLVPLPDVPTTPLTVYYRRRTKQEEEMGKHTTADPRLLRSCNFTPTGKAFQLTTDPIPIFKPQVTIKEGGKSRPATAKEAYATPETTGILSLSQSGELLAKHSDTPFATPIPDEKVITPWGGMTTENIDVPNKRVKINVQS